MNITEASLITVTFFSFWRSQIKAESYTRFFSSSLIKPLRAQLVVSQYFFFVFSIEATFSIVIGKFVNDSPQSFANCQMKQYLLDGIPHLCLVAKKKISKDTDLRYDYGDKPNQSWRGNVCHRFFQALLLDFVNFQYLWISVNIRVTESYVNIVNCWNTLFYITKII